MAVRGVNSEGLMTTVFPVASAGAIFHDHINTELPVSYKGFFRSLDFLRGKFPKNKVNDGNKEIHRKAHKE
jgi:hypothetical protein